ncbi:MAG TPA: hypothetical protein VIJ46_03225 [Rhabdochlamydiaceae bacterium]
MSITSPKDKQINPMLLVKKSYLVGFVGSIVVVILGLFAAQIINRYLSLDETMIRIFQAFSLVPGSAALFEVPGWDLETWNGGIPAEHLNKRLFICFSLVGLFLPVIAFSLQSGVITELPAHVEAKIVERVKQDILRELAQVVLNKNS